MLLEFAKTSDAEEIVQIYADGFPAGGGRSQRCTSRRGSSYQGEHPAFPPDPGTSLVSYTPLGCPGALEYVTDLIKLRNHGCDTKFIVARDEGIAGFFEVRLYGDELFANGMYVRPDKRTGGLGRRLWKRGLELTRQEGMSRVRTDVLIENELVRNWYQSRVGFTPIEEYLWTTMELESGTSPEDFSVSGLPQADCVHARYGFSQFLVRTARGSYEMGRLGDRLFRATDARVLDDSAALWGLRQLDPSRHLLLVCRNDLIDVELHPQLVPINKAVRFVHDDLDKLMAYMGS